MDDYFAESEEHLTAIKRSLLMLESVLGGSEPPIAVAEELFRSFHSIKGISAMVELREAERLAHEMEACLSSIRGGQRFTLSAAGFEALVEGTNLLDRVIAARGAARPFPKVGQQIARMAAVFAEGMSKPGTSRCQPLRPAASCGRSRSRRRRTWWRAG